MSDKRIQDLTYETVLDGSNTVAIDKSGYTEAKRTTIDDIKDFCAVVAGGMTSWIIIADGGTENTVTNGEKIEFIAGTNVTIAAASVSGGHGIEISSTGGGAGELDDLTDVNITSPSTSTNLLSYNGSNWVNVGPENIGMIIDDIVNVDTSGVSDGDVLEFNSGNWEPVTPSTGGMTSWGIIADGGTENTVTNGEKIEFIAGSNITIAAASISGGHGIEITSTGGGATELNDLTDVNTSGVGTDDILVYNSVGSVWEVGSLSLGLNNLNDVTITSPSTTVNLLSYNGSGWVNVGPENIGMLIQDLVNVDTSGVSDGDVLIFDSGNWEPGTPTGSGASELDDLSDVDLGSGPNDGDVLIYNDDQGEWYAEQPSVVNINDLGDVNTSGLAQGSLLSYNVLATSWNAVPDDSMKTLEVGADGSSNSFEFSDGFTLLFGGSGSNVEMYMEEISATEFKIVTEVTGGVAGDSYTGVFEFTGDGTTTSWTVTPSGGVDKTRPVAMLYDDTGKTIGPDFKNNWIQRGMGNFNIVFNVAPANGDDFSLRYTC